MSQIGFFSIVFTTCFMDTFSTCANNFLVFQFGNTCYCNSVLQALYFCRPFREKVLAYKSQPRKKENLLTCLADLFHSIATQKKKVGVIPPKKFITRLRKENGNSLFCFRKCLHLFVLFRKAEAKCLCCPLFCPIYSYLIKLLPSYSGRWSIIIVDILILIAWLSNSHLHSVFQDYKFLTLLLSFILYIVPSVCIALKLQSAI